MVGLGKYIEAIPEITSEIGHTTAVKVDIEREVKVGIGTGPVIERKDKCLEQNLEIEIEIETWKEKVGPLQNRSSSHINTNRDRLRCYTCSENDHFTRECPIALTDEESGSESEELDDSTQQMLSQVETSPFQDFDMQDLNM